MADRTKYPQIPGTVWWGVRAILRKSPKATINIRLLGVELGVQGSAARQYLAELRHVGLIDDEGRPTELANKWRLDESYPKAVSQILERVYPDDLRSIAPPGDIDRNKVVSWFEHDGFGRGAANNKAASYMLIAASEPADAPGKPGQKKGSVKKAPLPSAKKVPMSPKTPRSSADSGARSDEGTFQGGSTVPLNLNLQIHISADATSEQIEAIFAAMRRYLYDRSDS